MTAQASAKTANEGASVAPVDQVTGWHDQRQPRRIANLAERDQQSRGPRTGVQVVGDQMQQRLGVVEVRDGQAGRQSEQQRQPAPDTGGRGLPGGGGGRCRGRAGRWL
jgi:hypothetical protein